MCKKQKEINEQRKELNNMTFFDPYANSDMYASDMYASERVSAMSSEEEVYTGSVKPSKRDATKKIIKDKCKSSYPFLTSTLFFAVVGFNAAKAKKQSPGFEDRKFQAFDDSQERIKETSGSEKEDVTDKASTNPEHILFDNPYGMPDDESISTSKPSDNKGEEVLEENSSPTMISDYLSDPFGLSGGMLIPTELVASRVDQVVKDLANEDSQSSNTNSFNDADGLTGYNPFYNPFGVSDYVKESSVSDTNLSNDVNQADTKKSTNPFDEGYSTNPFDSGFVKITSNENSSSYKPSNDSSGVDYDPNWVSDGLVPAKQSLFTPTQRKVLIVAGSILLLAAGGAAAYYLYPLATAANAATVIEASRAVMTRAHEVVILPIFKNGMIMTSKATPANAAAALEFGLMHTYQGLMLPGMKNTMFITSLLMKLTVAPVANYILLPVISTLFISALSGIVLYYVIAPMVWKLGKAVFWKAAEKVDNRLDGTIPGWRWIKTVFGVTASVITETLTQKDKTSEEVKSESSNTVVEEDKAKADDIKRQNNNRADYVESVYTDNSFCGL